MREKNTFGKHCSPQQNSSKLPYLIILFQFYMVQPYGEVNSVKNTTINIWLNDGVY